MNQNRKQEIALMRYSVIAPLITGAADDYPSLSAFFRDASARGISLSDFVEMDTVISSGDCLKSILTFYFTDTGLFLAFLLNRCTKAAVRTVFDRLEQFMGTYEFLSLFEYVLTDRGAEFGDPLALETGVNDIQRTSIYYCDPMSSGQKGGIEEVHTLLRMILPKKNGLFRPHPVGPSEDHQPHQLLLKGETGGENTLSVCS